MADDRGLYRLIQPVQRLVEYHAGIARADTGRAKGDIVLTDFLRAGARTTRSRS
jgi:hypothetical protein